MCGAECTFLRKYTGAKFGPMFTRSLLAMALVTVELPPLQTNSGALSDPNRLTS